VKRITSNIVTRLRIVAGSSEDWLNRSGAWEPRCREPPAGECVVHSGDMIAMSVEWYRRGSQSETSTRSIWSTSGLFAP
jgi:hypothetical protein